MARTCTKFARYYVRFRSLPWQHRWLNATLKFWIYWVYANPKSLDYSLQLLTLFWTIYAYPNWNKQETKFRKKSYTRNLIVAQNSFVQLLFSGFHCLKLNMNRISAKFWKSTKQVLIHFELFLPDKVYMLNTHVRP